MLINGLHKFIVADSNYYYYYYYYYYYHYAFI